MAIEVRNGRLQFPTKDKIQLLAEAVARLDKQGRDLRLINHQLIHLVGGLVQTVDVLRLAMLSKDESIGQLSAGTEAEVIRRARDLYDEAREAIAQERFKNCPRCHTSPEQDKSCPDCSGTGEVPMTTEERNAAMVAESLSIRLMNSVNAKPQEASGEEQ